MPEARCMTNHLNPMTGQPLIPSTQLTLADVPRYDYEEELNDPDAIRALDEFCLYFDSYEVGGANSNDYFLMHWALLAAFSTPDHAPWLEVRDLVLARSLLFAYQRCAHNEPYDLNKYPGLGAYINWLLESVRAAIRRRDDQRLPIAQLDPDITPVSLSSRFAAGLEYAFELHREQRRKGSGIPYLGHLLGVCSLVIEDGGTEDEAIAALLHDAAEDAGGVAILEQIESRFGPLVSSIVEECSDTFQTPKPPWRERKEEYIEHLASARPSTLRVSLADKLFNARALMRDYKLVGDRLWDRFVEGEQSQLWYYSALADRYLDLLPGQMANELRDSVDELQRLVDVSKNRS